VTVLMYNLLFPAKSRRVVFDKDDEDVLKEVCHSIEKRYEVEFLEIGTDKYHVHFFCAISSAILRGQGSEDYQKCDGK
jgi:putative transposase